MPAGKSGRAQSASSHPEQPSFGLLPGRGAPSESSSTCFWKIGVEQERAPAHFKGRLPLEIGQRLLQA